MIRILRNARTIDATHKPVLSRFLAFWLAVLTIAVIVNTPPKVCAYDDIENHLGIPLVFDYGNSIYSYHYNKKTREVLISKFNTDTRETSVEGNFIFPEGITAIAWRVIFIDNNIYLPGYNEISGDSYSYLINTKGEIVLKDRFIRNKFEIYLSFVNGKKKLSYYNVSDNLKYRKYDISIEYEFNDKIIWKQDYVASNVRKYDDEIWVIDYASKKSYHLDIETGKTIETYEGEVNKVFRHNQTRIIVVTNPDKKTGYLHYKNPKLNISKKIYSTGKDGRLVIDKKNGDLYFANDFNAEDDTLVLTKISPFAQTKIYRIFIEPGSKPFEFGTSFVVLQINNGMVSLLIDSDYRKIGFYRIDTGELIQSNVLYVFNGIEMFDDYYIARDKSNYYVFDYSNTPKLIWMLETPGWNISEEPYKTKTYCTYWHYEYPENKFAIKCGVYDTKTKEILEDERYEYVVEVKSISEAYFQITPTVHGLLHIATNNEIDKSIKLYKPLKSSPEFSIPINDGYNYAFEKYSEDDNIVLIREYYLKEPEKIRKLDLTKGQFVD